MIVNKKYIYKKDTIKSQTVVMVPTWQSYYEGYMS